MVVGGGELSQGIFFSISRICELSAFLYDISLALEASLPWACVFYLFCQYKAVSGENMREFP